MYDILPQGASELPKSKLNIPLLLVSKVKSPNLQVVAVLKLLEIKHHTVPHLKGLNSGLEPLDSLGRGSNSMGPMLA